MKKIYEKNLWKKFMKKIYEKKLFSNQFNINETNIVWNDSKFREIFVKKFRIAFAKLIAK